MKNFGNKKPDEYFIPEYGSYYHFITESAMGLYRVLRKHRELKGKNCRFWYKGRYAPIVQLFSSHPVQVVKNKAEIPPDMMVLRHFRPNVLQDWIDLMPLSNYLESLFPPASEIQGITVIRRVKNRCYLDHDKLITKLQKLEMPVREVTLEQLSLGRQINLMHNTRVLIGPHGAGLTNLMFLPKNSLIVELNPLGYFNRLYGTMAQAFGHNYLDIEASTPSTLGREPLPQLKDFFHAQKWPSRSDMTKGKPCAAEMGRVLRDVASFAIDPQFVLNRIEQALISVSA